jgi:hypothetical protein
MADHLTAEQIAGFQARTLPPNEMVAVDRHLWECDTCRAADLSDISSARVERSLRVDSKLGDEHLSFEQLKQIVDRQVSASERMELNKHLAGCDRCSADLADLQTFSAEVAVVRRRPGLSQRWKVGLAAAAMLLIVVTMARLGGSSGGSTTQARLGGQGEITGTIELVDNGMTIVATDAGVRGLDTIPPQFREVIATTLARLRRPPSLTPEAVSANPSLMAAARAQYPRFHLLLGALALRAGDYANAEVEFRSLLDANPGSVAAQRLLAEARQTSR